MVICRVVRVSNKKIGDRDETEGGEGRGSDVRQIWLMKRKLQVIGVKAGAEDEEEEEGHSSATEKSILRPDEAEGTGKLQHPPLDGAAMYNRDMATPL